MGRWVACFAVLAIGLVLVTGAGAQTVVSTSVLQARPQAAPDLARLRAEHISGLVFSRRIHSGVPSTEGSASSASPSASGFGSGNLTYHGGTVMRTNTMYAIYWIPSGYSVSANYESLINGYLQNVAAASGQSDNVYSVDSEYSDSSGPIAYDSTFGGAYVDTSPFPANDCSDAGLSVCLTNSQIQAEIDKDISSQSWSAGSTSQFILLTPQTVGSCTDSGSATCAYTAYCAYHSWFNSSLGNGTVVYTNQPYTSSSAAPAGCDQHERPNGDDADPTINTLSHETNEAITDGLPGGWFDDAGYENADKCAWTFGSPLGATGGTNTDYNEQIGTGKYWLQEEWSNKTIDPFSGNLGSCVQRYANPQVVLTGTGTGGVTPDTGSLSCAGTTCDLSSYLGSMVTLTAQPSAGSTFAGWVGDCSGSSTCTVTVSQSTSVAARFTASGTPPGWSEHPLAPPSGTDVSTAGNNPSNNFFTVAESADGTERATSVYQLPGDLVESGGFCLYDTTDTGGVFLQTKIGSTWTDDGKITRPSVGTDSAKNWVDCHSFGAVSHLSADGSTLLLSQEEAFVYSGEHGFTYRCAAFVYHLTNSGWTLDGTLLPPGVDEYGSATEDGCAHFGFTSALSGDGLRAAVMSRGRVDVFVRGVSGWSLEQHIDLPSANNCGVSQYQSELAISGDGSRLLVGDPSCTRVLDYERAGSAWSLADTITSSESFFGMAVTLASDGKTAVISAMGSEGPLFAGAAWVYEHGAGGWQAGTMLTASTPQERTAFNCHGITPDGSRIECDAIDTVGFNSQQGSVYIFDRPGTSWVGSATPLHLFAQDGHSGDQLNTGPSQGFPTSYVMSADGDIALPIGAGTVGLYGGDRIGYEFDSLAAPGIDSFTPGTGDVGTPVTINGTNLANAIAVYFNGTSAPITADSATSITATVPAGATTGPISVTTTGGTVTTGSDFTPVMHSLTVSRNGEGSVTSLPAGIDCGSTCSNSFGSGASVTLTETPAAGWSFSGWAGACSGTSTTCHLSMTTDRAATATFATTLTVSRQGTGTGTVTSTPAGINCGSTCSHAFAGGSSVTLTASAAAGSTFTGWSGDCSGSVTTCQLPMTAAHSAVATFTTNPLLTVMAIGTGLGSITSSPAGISCPSTCSVAFSVGASVTLTATPSPGSTFTGWSGDCSGTVTTCQLPMNGAHLAMATFTTNPLLTVATSGDGTGSVTSNPSGISCGSTCSHDFAVGASVTLTATAASGSTFTGWSGDCSGTGPTCQLLMSSAHSATATFTANPPSPVRCTVPKLKGKTLPAAKRALTRAHCALGSVKKAHSSHKKGTVVGQRAKPGSKHAKGYKVGVTVSEGPKH